MFGVLKIAKFDGILTVNGSVYRFSPSRDSGYLIDEIVTSPLSHASLLAYIRGSSSEIETNPEYTGD